MPLIPEKLMLHFPLLTKQTLMPEKPYTVDNFADVDECELEWTPTLTLMDKHC